MAYAQVIYLCCLLLRSALALQLPSSPCPNVFVYEGDAESDRWHGVITFSSNIELVGMNYKVQLDRPSQLLVSWDGEVRTDDNTNYNVFDPFHTQRGGEVVKARIMVKFNPSNGIPTILRIVINGNTMCARDGNYGSGIGVGLSAESTTERYDPSFNEGDEVTSGLSNNRGQGQSSNNYGGNSPSYSSNNNNNGNNNNENNQNFETRPNSNRPSSYGNNEGSYSSGSPDLPNYNSNSNSNSNPNRPNYSNGGATNSPVYVVNPSNSGTNSNAGPYAPTNSNSHFNGNSNGYSGMGGGGGGGGGGGSFGNGDYVSNNRPQWSSDTSLANNYNNRTSGGGSGSNWQNQNQNNAFSNSPATTSAESNANGEPVVTTLTIPNANANKTNVDQIVQIIKNQLEQQQIAGGSNKTVIVAVVNSNSNSNSNLYSYSTPNSGSQISSSSSNSNNNNNNNNISATTTDPSVVYRTTTVPTSTLSAKAKIVASTAKSSGSSNGHTSRP